MRPLTPLSRCWTTNMDRSPLARTNQFAIEPLECRLQLSVSLILGGAQALMAGTNRNVSMDATDDECEVQIATNPKNPLNLIAMSTRVGPAPELSHSVDTWYSVNGGISWTKRSIGSSVDGVAGALSRIDPSVAFDADGNAYIAYGVRTSFNPPVKQLVVARSTNGGDT